MSTVKGERRSGAASISGFGSGASGASILDDILAMQRRFDAMPPRSHCVLVDANMPSGLCACLPPDRAIVEALYGTGAEADDVWRAMDGMRLVDHALVVPTRAEAHLLSTARMDPASAVNGLFGLRVWHVRSRDGAPWHALVKPFRGEA